MITRTEIDAKAEEFKIQTSNVQRDYVYGWVLNGLFQQTELKDRLVLKGGNAFRKAYFASTRFSNDLDFSCTERLDLGLLRDELSKLCAYLGDTTGVKFDTDRTLVKDPEQINKEVRVIDVRLFFADFYGNEETIAISVQLDIAEFEQTILPVQTRRIIHPYSDADACSQEIRCHQLEELLATKLKCLIQRQHVADLYDFVYWAFFSGDIAVDRLAIANTFLRKTIFGPSPASAKDILVKLPLSFARSAWDRYIVCPVSSVLNFDRVSTTFTSLIEDLFASFGESRMKLAFYPAEYRNAILEAGREGKLLNLRYDSCNRLVEPYSLRFKRRKDGVGQEYFYGWDRSGGNSGQIGIKTFLHTGISSIEVTTELFTPRFPVEVTKAGEYGPKTRFSDGVATTTRRMPTRRTTRAAARYTVQCSSCGKRFRRARYSTHLGKHKDRYGNQCYGRTGFMV